MVQIPVLLTLVWSEAVIKALSVVQMSAVSTTEDCREIWVMQMGTPRSG